MRRNLASSDVFKVEIINHLSRDKRADVALSKGALIEKLIALISNSECSVPLKVQGLKLILHQITCTCMK